MAETRADDMPRVRDEVAAQLHRLADLVQNDRWEEAERLAPVVTSAYSTCCNRWRSLKQKRAAERSEQLEANRSDYPVPKNLIAAWAAEDMAADHGYSNFIRIGRMMMKPRWVEATIDRDAAVAMGHVQYPEWDP
jgi:hypothetical protein